MRHASKRSPNVVDRDREGENGHVATAQYSYPEVSFQTEEHDPSGAESRRPPEGRIAPETCRNGSSAETDSAVAEEAGEIASLHEQHARQIEAVGRERNALAQRLAGVERELAQTRKDHAEELERTRLDRDELIKAKENLSMQLAHLREDHREQVESFAATRMQLAAERDRLTVQLAEWRERHHSETGVLVRDHETVARTLAREREQRHREMAELTARYDQLTRDHNELAAELDRARKQHEQHAATLTAERDALRREIEVQTAVITEKLESHKTELATLAAKHEQMTTDRYRISAEFSTFREAHYTEIEALTGERDQLRAAEADLRAHLAVVNEGHGQEISELRREHAAVIKEADSTHELLEADRLAWRKQMEFFATERETLSRERDEALGELARERQAEGEQIGLRSLECENLQQQRAELLGQLEESRAVEQRQNALFHDERRILCEERDRVAARLTECMEALGQERMTLLQQKNAVEASLDATRRESGEKVASLEAARVKAAGERDAALRELAVFRDTHAREQSLLGAAGNRKYALDSMVTRDGLLMRCAAKDAALDRDVEVCTIHGGATSDERRGELIAEARHLARLQHPGIPPIYEAGFDETGQAFYAAKPVSGKTLREILDELERGKTSSLLHFSLRRLLSVFHRVCDALAYAHAQEISHGALTPKHIVLGEFGEVFVTGWQVPRAIGDGGEREAGFRPREDITALARILYEMTNLLPAPQADAVLPGARRGKGTPAHAWAGDKDVSGLAAIAKRALDPKVAGRFYSVRELQKQVDSFKDSFDDPTRVTLETIVRQWFYRRRIVLILVTLALALVIAGGIWLATSPREVGGIHERAFQTREPIVLPPAPRP